MLVIVFKYLNNCIPEYLSNLFCVRENIKNLRDKRNRNQASQSTRPSEGGSGVACRVFSSLLVACFVRKNFAVEFSLERQMSLSVLKFSRCGTIEIHIKIFTLS